ncbi:response regulator transcription factor [Aeromonas salmonicida]|uniref:response regulator transcription factor n=1 Tax=Aeromonas salmonicida TaxID=645 RepID=UPI003D03DF21
MAKILIVDDHPAIRMAVNILLEQDGHHIVAEVDNGVDAIVAAKKHQPDIIVLDIGIPKLDGIEVIKKIKALREFNFEVRHSPMPPDGTLRIP